MNHSTYKIVSITQDTVHFELSSQTRVFTVENLNILLSTIEKTLQEGQIFDGGFVTITVDAQRHVANYISTKKWDNESDKLKVYAVLVGAFTDGEAQIIIAESIYNEMWGKDSAVLKQLAKSIGHFTDGVAQGYIADSIRYKRFGINPDVLKELAKSIGHLTDRDAQKAIAVSMKYWIWNVGSDVLKELAKSIGHFTDGEAQRDISESIKRGNWGSDPDVLKELAKSIGHFTDAKAQRDIADSIKRGNWRSDAGVLKELAKSIGYFTDAKAQSTIANSIQLGRWGTNIEVFMELAKWVGCVTDTKAQYVICVSIYEGNWEGDPDVLKELIRSVAHFDVSVLNTAYHALFYFIGTLSQLVDVELQGHFKYSTERIVEKFLMMGGPESYCDDGDELVQEFRSVEAISRVLAPGIGKFGLTDSFGVCSHIQVFRGKLIVYMIAEDERVSDRDRLAAKEQYSGWLGGESHYLYNLAISRVKVFDLTVESGEYPVPVDLNAVVVGSDVFKHFPLYLQVAIRNTQFDVTQFKYPKLVRFVTEQLMSPFIEATQGKGLDTFLKRIPDDVERDELRSKYADLGKEMQAVIRSAILSQGRDQLFPVDKKDALNALAIKLYGDEYLSEASFNSIAEDLLRPVWTSLSVEDKVRLAYLLGQMAKAGVLGYHSGENNQANDFLYMLSLYVLKQVHVMPQSRSISGLSVAIDKLKHGDCIQVVTSELLMKNTFLDDVFEQCSVG